MRREGLQELPTEGLCGEQNIHSSVTEVPEKLRAVVVVDVVKRTVPAAVVP